MVSKPSLILADEPTANLDSKTGESLLDMMRTMNETTGMTFVFSTHDPMVMNKARRLITVQDGEIAEDKSKQG
jgi:putative ABC transport system ATP-binding protein